MYAHAHSCSALIPTHILRTPKLPANHLPQNAATPAPKPSGCCNILPKTGFRLLGKRLAS